MTPLAIVGLFVILIFIGVPIAFVIGIVSLLGIMSIPMIPNLTVFMKMFNGLNSFVLLAIPLFGEQRDLDVTFYLGVAIIIGAVFVHPMLERRRPHRVETNVAGAVD